MRAVVQRVSEASVAVDGRCVGSISNGLVVLLGIAKEDTTEDVQYLINKIKYLRVFEDENDKMNLSIADGKGSLLIVSQFTLYGDVRKGRRPSFDQAAAPDEAKRLYEYFLEECQNQEIPFATGTFQAHMHVQLVNDGPVTILLDSKKVF